MIIRHPETNIMQLQKLNVIVNSENYSIAKLTKTANLREYTLEVLKPQDFELLRTTDYLVDHSLYSTEQIVLNCYNVNSYIIKMEAHNITSCIIYQKSK